MKASQAFKHGRLLWNELGWWQEKALMKLLNTACNFLTENKFDQTKIESLRIKMKESSYWMMRPFSQNQKNSDCHQIQIAIKFRLPSNSDCHQKWNLLSNLGKY